MKVSSLYVLLAVLCAMSGNSASEWSYSIEDEMGYSSNIARAADNEIDEYTNTLRLGVNYRENSVELEGRVGANIEYLSYLTGVYENEVRGYLDANVKWILLQDRLFWAVEDRLSVEPVLTRQAWMPGNIQQTNVFSTGPSLNYRLDTAMRLTADMRYMNSYAEETEGFNSDRWYMGASLIHERSLSTNVSANLTWRSVDFGSESADDYRQLGLFAAWERQFGRSGLLLELGGLHVDFDSGNSEYGPYARLSWLRTISSTSRFQAGFSHGFSDAAEQVSGGTRVVPVSTNIISSQVYTNSKLELAYHREWARFSLGTSLSYQKQAFLSSPDLDQHLVNLGVIWERGFGGGTRMDLGISYFDTVYELDDRNDKTLAPFVTLYFQRSSHLTYRLRAALEKRDSSEEGADYTDSMFFATISYRR